MAHFITKASEKAVSREFHASRRDALSLLGPNGKQPADRTEVHAFLTSLELEATQSSLVPDARRARLLARMATAHSDVDQGKGPNRATFIAWKELRHYISNSEQAINAGPRPDTQTNYATEAEVAAARREYEVAEQEMESRIAHSDPLHVTATQTRQQMTRLRKLKERYQKLQASYDLTKDGFTDLRHAFRARGGGDPLLTARYQKAVAERQRLAAATKTAESSTSTEFHNVRRDRDAEKTRLRQVEAQYRANPSAPTKTAYIHARAEFQKTERRYLSSVAAQYPIASAIGTSGEPISVQSWAKIGSYDAPLRKDIWAAAEMLLVDQDAQEVRIGRITEKDAAKRSLRRAQARQYVLDGEGRDEVDPINRQFAESMLRKRGKS